MNYTPWERIFSYDADITMVIEARGHGKTFGLREQFVRDWVNGGERFVCVSRYETDIPSVARGFFDALYKTGGDGVAVSEVARRHVIVTRRAGHVMYAQIKPLDASDGWKPVKNKWSIIGYFVSLSKYQDYKAMTFANVRRIVLDEALIENPTGRHDYLPDEFLRLASVVDSTTRERADSGLHKPNVYLLANACGVFNPYFERYGITTVPPSGFSWWGGKNFLLYVGDDAVYSAEKQEGTVAGRMLAGAGDANDALTLNRFVDATDDMIGKKSPHASFDFGFIIEGREIGVWEDIYEGWYYMCNKTVKNGVVYALTTADARMNVLLAKRTQPQMKMLMEAYRMGLVKFEDWNLRRFFETRVAPLYGIR